MFLWNNIFFSLGFDVKDHYKDFGGDAAAYVAPVSTCMLLIIDHEAREIMYLVASVRPSVCPSVDTFTAELFDLRP